MIYKVMQKGHGRGKIQEPFAENRAFYSLVNSRMIKGIVLAKRIARTLIKSSILFIYLFYVMCQAQVRTTLSKH